MNVGFPIDGPLLLAAIVMVVGLVVVGMSDRVRVPASLLALGIGMLIGSEGLGLIDAHDFTLIRDISIICLIVILFEGGLTTKPSAIRTAGLPGFVLANFGVLFTAGVTAVGVQLLFQPGWETSLILGAVVASTDAAVVFDLLRHAPLPKRLGSILEVESGANDPFAILLTIGLVEAARSSVQVGDAIRFGATQLLGGIVVGLVIGWLGTRLLKVRLRSDGLYPLLATGIAGLAYGAAAAVSASGFLAVYVAGLVVGALVPRHRRMIRSFHLSLARGTDLVLFLTLGILVFPSELPGVMLIGLGMTAILVLVARPIAVVLSLIPFSFTWREQVLLSWAGLRGAVPIVLATIPATAGIAAGEAIFNIVFFVVVISTLLQGTTVAPLTRRLGLAVDRPPWESIAEALPLDGVDVDLVEITVTSDLPIVGQRLRDVPPGSAMLVATVVRGHKAILPRADTRFESGDLIVMAVDRHNADLAIATAWAKGETPEPVVAWEASVVDAGEAMDEDQPA